MALGVTAAIAVAGCTPRRPIVPNPTYTVGAPYQTGGVWRYPRESFDLDETGLAAIASRGAGLTADGELFDQTAIAAGHRSLQLPAIARVTNLDNGRMIALRINDRGPSNPARLIELTRRTADLLQAGDGTRLRVQVLDGESRQVATSMQARSPNPAQLQLAAAPRGGVQTEALAPPPGAGTRAPRSIVALPSAAPGAATPDTARVPARMPETVQQGSPRPGRLAIECGSFGRPEYAEILRARLAGLGAQTTTSYDAPRDRAFQVRIGGLANVAQAEAMLSRALAAGVTDARIIVE